MTELGEQIRLLRQAKGFSQEALAAHLNVSRQAVSKWEKGLSHPDTENLLALAALFGVSADELAGLRLQGRTELPEPTLPEKKKRAWLPAVACAVSAIVMVLCVLRFTGVGDKTPPGESDPGPVEIPLPGSAEISSPDAGGTQTPASRPTAAEAGEFALLWKTETGWEHLSSGAQKEVFPFGTSLVPTEMEKVSDTDFRTMTVHDVTCGALSLRYLHIRDEGAPPVETLIRAATITAGYETPRGIGVGSDESAVLRLYGDELLYEFKDTGEDILCRHDHKYIYSPAEAGGTAVIFYIAGGHVAGLEVWAGDDRGSEAWSVDHVTRFPVKDGAPDFSQRQEPEREETDATRAVYIALYALQEDANLSAEDKYRHRRTVYANLQHLDWQAYGKMGELGREDETRQELLRWLLQWETLSADEIAGLLAGACRSNLDGWLTDSYATAVAQACGAYPKGYFGALVSGGFTEAEQKELISMTAYACRGDGNLLREVIAATEGDPLRFTDAERVWAEALLEKLRAD